MIAIDVGAVAPVSHSDSKDRTEPVAGHNPAFRERWFDLSVRIERDQALCGGPGKNSIRRSQGDSVRIDLCKTRPDHADLRFAVVAGLATRREQPGHDQDGVKRTMHQPVMRTARAGRKRSCRS